MSADQGPLLVARELVVEYRTPRGPLRAVDGVGFELHAGETLGIVGESGCGKSSLARALLRLAPLSGGTITWCGRDLATLRGAQLRRTRRDLQVVFQDPLASLDPRLTIAQSVAEPLRVQEPQLSRSAVAERVFAMLARVGLGAELAERLPHQLSGGQCQRAGIARAMILRPRLLVCDEPVSALDRSVQGQILNLLRDLQREQRTALVFVSHDLALVRRLCHRVLVMYMGRVMEIGPSAALFAGPLHPYTGELLEAAPVADPVLERARPPAPPGEIASPFAPPSGCAFRTRCPHARPVCGRERPVPEPAAVAGHAVACLRWRELAGATQGGAGVFSAAPAPGAVISSRP